MAFITVISTTNSIKVDFGVYAGMTVPSGLIPKKRGFQKREVTFSLISDESMVEAITIYNKLTFPISVDGVTGTFKVELVDGVTPTDNLDLYNKLMTLIE